MRISDSADENFSAASRRCESMSRRNEMTIRVAIRPYRFALLSILALAAFVWVPSPARAQAGIIPVAATESAPVPAAQIPQPITDAIKAPNRPPAHTALDAGPKPT